MILGPDGKRADGFGTWLDGVTLRVLEETIAKQSAFARCFHPTILNEFGRPIEREVYGVGATITIRLPRRFR